MHVPKIIYPGSFDPMTSGHLDIIERAAKLGDRLIIGVLQNAAKSAMFSVEERIRILRSETDRIPNVEVKAFDGLLVDFCKQEGATLVVRGLRAVSDFEYELQMAQANKNIFEEMETLFLSTNAQYSFISSTIVKELIRHGGNAAHLVPKNAMKTIEDILGGRNNGNGSC